MRILWWIFFIPIVAYELWWLWLYVSTRNDFLGFHPWYFGLGAAIIILGLIRLYPLARNYDQMGKM